MDSYNYPSGTRAVLEGMKQPLAVFQNLEGRVRTVLLSDGFCRLFGYRTRAEAVNIMDTCMFRDTHPDDRARLAEAVKRFTEKDEEFNVVYRTRAGVNEGYRVVHARGQHILTETGARISHIWYMDEGVYVEGKEDVGTQMNRTLNSALHEESILYAVHHDELTGLPNLSYFFKLCEAGKARLFREGKHGSLLYIDLEGMKYFNHRYGFQEGDALLKAIAETMISVFGKEQCCHVAADRFAAAAVESDAEELVDRFFAEAARINGGRNLPLRVGIYDTSLEDVPVSTAFDRAKIACEAVRIPNSSARRHYSAELLDAIRQKQYIIANLDRAIAGEWIQVYYQPIVRATSERVCDEEALARWNEPGRGFLSPALFIPYLEDAGLIYKLDLYVLEKVLEKMHRLREAGLTVVPHSINLSRSDFDACDIVEEVRKRVDASEFDRGKITIEITESTVGRDMDFMKEQISRFRKLGFQVWMDDFGSGYSSLDVLQSIPFDLIKFDMSFMQKMDQGDSGKIILTELMKMANALRLDTVCEGVETETQVRFLKEIGCSKIQGFYFCRPISYEQLLERYRSGTQIGFEDPQASGYFEAIGRVNLYDLDVIAAQDESSFQNAFNTVPMGIIEIRGDQARIIRTNPSYRAFFRRFFGMDILAMMQIYGRFDAEFMKHIVRVCCEEGQRAFFNEKMPDGSVVHSFARKISTNPVTGDIAVWVAVLSISEPRSTKPALKKGTGRKIRRIPGTGTAEPRLQRSRPADTGKEEQKK